MLSKHYLHIEARKLSGSKTVVLNLLLTALVLTVLYHVVIYQSFDQAYINAFHLKLVKESFHFWLYKVNQVWMFSHVLCIGLLSGLWVHLENKTGWKHFQLFPVSLSKTLLYKQLLVYLVFLVFMLAVSIPTALLSAQFLDLRLAGEPQLQAFFILVAHHGLGGMFYCVLAMALAYVTKSKPSIFYFLIGFLALLGSFGVPVSPGYSFGRIANMPQVLRDGIPLSLILWIGLTLLVAGFCYLKDTERKEAIIH